MRMSSSGGWKGESKEVRLGMFKSSMKMTRFLPLAGPILSLERFFMGPSMISCTVEEVVAAEKLTTICEKCQCP